MSKCTRIVKGRYDNGRVIGAEELEIVLTDIDLKFIFDTHEIESYEFLEVYWAYKDYLPIEYIKFTLDKYENKTKYKNVEGKEIEYALEKASFNSLYGMMVTQTITDSVEYKDENGWNEIPLTNEEIENLLAKQKKNSFLSFSWRNICDGTCKI